MHPSPYEHVPNILRYTFNNLYIFNKFAIHHVDDSNVWLTFRAQVEGLDTNDAVEHFLNDKKRRKNEKGDSIQIAFALILLPIMREFRFLC